MTEWVIDLFFQTPSCTQHSSPNKARLENMYSLVELLQLWSLEKCTSSFFVNCFGLTALHFQDRSSVAVTKTCNMVIVLQSHHLSITTNTLLQLPFSFQCLEESNIYGLISVSLIEYNPLSLFYKFCFPFLPVLSVVSCRYWTSLPTQFYYLDSSPTNFRFHC